VRVAEEMAFVDVLSMAGLRRASYAACHMKFPPAIAIRYAPTSVFAEALDSHHQGFGPATTARSVTKAGSFHHRQSQYLAPPLPSTASAGLGQHDNGQSGAMRVGAQGLRAATFLTGYDGTRRVYDAYRVAGAKPGGGQDVPIDRLAYAALVYVGDNEADARGRRREDHVVHSRQQGAATFLLPSRIRPAAGLRTRYARRSGRSALLTFPPQGDGGRGHQTGLMMAGTPDQVYAQIRKMYDHVGGFGHLLSGPSRLSEHDRQSRKHPQFCAPCLSAAQSGNA